MKVGDMEDCGLSDDTKVAFIDLSRDDSSCYDHGGGDNATLIEPEKNPSSPESDRFHSSAGFNLDRTSSCPVRSTSISPDPTTDLLAAEEVHVATTEKPVPSSISPAGCVLAAGNGNSDDEEEWCEMFARLFRFKEKEGHVEVPRDYQADPELGAWVLSQQLQHWKKENGFAVPLDDRRAGRLTSLGVTWRFHRAQNDVAFIQLFDRLVDFKRQHGHTRVLLSHDSELFYWDNKARHRYRHGQLSESRMAALDSIGVDIRRKPNEWWDARWNEQFENLVEFREQHGHSDVTKKDDPRLCRWIWKQRSNRRRRKLPEERKLALDSIGFDWDPLSGGVHAVNKKAKESSMFALPKQATRSSTLSESRKKAKLDKHPPTGPREVAVAECAGSPKTAQSPAATTTTTTTTATEEAQVDDPASVPHGSFLCCRIFLNGHGCNMCIFLPLVSTTLADARQAIQAQLGPHRIAVDMAWHFHLPGLPDVGLTTAQETLLKVTDVADGTGNVCRTDQPPSLYLVYDDPDSAMH